MKSGRTALLILLFLGVLSAPLAVEAQQAGKVWRIGVVSEATRSETIEARWRTALRQRGYVEGQNLVLHFVWGDDRVARLPEQVAELVRSDVDVILAPSTPAAIAAKKGTTTIPIITISGVPVDAGLVASLARPGGNVTGVFLSGADLEPKRLQLLREIVPGLDNVAIVFNPGNAAAATHAKITEAAARAVGIMVHVFELRTQADVETVVAEMVKKRARGVIVIQDPIAFRAAGKLAQLTVKHGLPATHFYREFADAGGLFTYGVSLPGVSAMVADYVDKVLRGAKPADMPMEQPTRVEFVINRKTAKALGLTIPPSLLLRADHVIE